MKELDSVWFLPIAQTTTPTTGQHVKPRKETQVEHGLEAEVYPGARARVLLCQTAAEWLGIIFVSYSIA
jgi:hypothetical protein